MRLSNEVKQYMVDEYGYYVNDIVETETNSIQIWDGFEYRSMRWGKETDESDNYIDCDYFYKETDEESIKEEAKLFIEEYLETPQLRKYHELYNIKRTITYDGRPVTIGLVKDLSDRAMVRCGDDEIYFDAKFKRDGIELIRKESLESRSLSLYINTVTVLNESVENLTGENIEQMLQKVEDRLTVIDRFKQLQNEQKDEFIQRFNAHYNT